MYALRWLLTALLAFASQAAFAFPPVAGWVCGGTSSGVSCRPGSAPYATPEEGCADVAAYNNGVQGYDRWTYTAWTPPYCTMSRKLSAGATPEPGYQPAQMSSGSACPANSTGTSSCTCNSGYAESTSGGVTTCVADTSNCSSGGAGAPIPGSGTMSRTVNVTIGWARTPVAGAPYVPTQGDSVNYGDNVCSAGCNYTVNSPSGCYRSQEQNSVNSMYRVSCDFRAVATGSSCTTDSSGGGADPATVEPACSGEIIEVPNSGGRTLCVVFPGGTNEEAPANSPAPEQFGNPSAGNQPSTGQGSGSGPGGRTPTTGEGGNEGGGSGSAAPSTDYAGGGGGGVGSVNGQALVSCGLPDTAPCKIDETGTGDGSGSQTGNEAGVDGARDGHAGVIEGWGTNTDHAPEWTWTFALPATCSPIPLTAFAPFIESIDVCQFQPVIHDLMSLVWIAAAIFGCTAMVFRTLNTG